MYLGNEYEDKNDAPRDRLQRRRPYADDRANAFGQIAAAADPEPSL